MNPGQGEKISASLGSWEERRSALASGPLAAAPVFIRLERFVVFQASGSSGGWVTLINFLRNRGRKGE